MKKNFFRTLFSKRKCVCRCEKEIEDCRFTRSKFLTYEVLVPDSVPIGSRMTSAAPRPVFLYDPSTWVWIPDPPGRDVALPFCGGLVSAGQSVRRLLCAFFNNRKGSVVGKEINFSRSSFYADPMQVRITAIRVASPSSAIKVNTSMRTAAMFLVRLCIMNSN